MNQYLWINRWNDIRNNSAITKQKEGLTFISTYTMEDFKRVLSELYMGLQMNEGSMTSRYVCFIPPNGNEVIKLRLSDHPSSPSEWGEKEITGLPNRRYSIVIFSRKSMPIETKQGIKELDWKSYSAQNIPTYEKTFNRYYLRETFNTLKSILATIYQGGSPEDKTIPINLTENKHNTNMNKKLIRLTESDLHQIVKESVNKVFKEADRHRPGYFKGKPDRHREGYWKERWAKQKAAKQAESEKDADTSEKPQKQASKPQKDRHRKGYYHDYNQAHPERLDRGFTKGYNNGNVSDGLKQKKRQWLNKTLGIYIIGYDELGRPITNNPFGDMLRNKEMEWHDDDWDEGSWDD